LHRAKSGPFAGGEAALTNRRVQVSTVGAVRRDSRGGHNASVYVEVLKIEEVVRE